MGDRLATIDTGRKLGAGALFSWGELDPHLTQCGLGRGLHFESIGILIRRAVWPQQTGRTVGAAVPFLGRGAGFQSNTMSPGPRPTFLPSGILIHPTVWPQYTNVSLHTDRTDSEVSSEVSRV